MAFISVIMITYNHEKFIREAVNSVLFQKTNFDYELIIANDCSPDQTDKVVHEIINTHSNGKRIKYFRHEKNIGVCSNFLFALKQSSGKYIAICEGDDYWTDSYKLQKQVDFLENNPEYGLVHGDVNHLYENTGEIVYAYNKTNKIIIPEGYIFEDLMTPSHLIKTMTVCFRKELLEKYYLNNNEVMQSNWKLIDISVWLMFSLHSKIHYFDEVFATYRLSDESASRSKNPTVLYKAHQNVFAIREYFADRYEVDDRMKKGIKVHIYRSNLMDAYGIKSKEISENAKHKLKQLGIRLSLRETIFYYGTKHRVVRKLIDLFAAK